VIDTTFFDLLILEFRKEDLNLIYENMSVNEREISCRFIA